MDVSAIAFASSAMKLMPLRNKKIPNLFSMNLRNNGNFPTFILTEQHIMTGKTEDELVTPSDAHAHHFEADIVLEKLDQDHEKVCLYRLKSFRACN